MILSKSKTQVIVLAIILPKNHFAKKHTQTQAIIPAIILPIPTRISYF
jgi:hypothetical protein